MPNLTEAQATALVGFIDGLAKEQPLFVVAALYGFADGLTGRHVYLQSHMTDEQCNATTLGYVEGRKYRNPTGEEEEEGI